MRTGELEKSYKILEIFYWPGSKYERDGWIKIEVRHDLMRKETFDNFGGILGLKMGYGPLNLFQIVSPSL